MASFVAGVSASTLAYFSDETCSTPLLELSKAEKWSVNTVPFHVNTCTTLDPPIEIEVGTVKRKYGFSSGVICGEYGLAAVTLFSDKATDCLIDPKKLAGDTPEHYIKMQAAESSVCYLSNEDARTSGQADKDVYVKADCNPNNGSIAGIVMGTIGLVLSLAAIGLAAVAMGKKGQAPAKAAQPAQPAGPGPQGSTTAAAAVGAATDA